MVLIPLAIVLPLVVFYLWMLRDLMNKDVLGPPPLVISPSSDFKYNWMFDFILLNVFAAAIYFATEYRNRKP